MEIKKNKKKRKGMKVNMIMRNKSEIKNKIENKNNDEVKGIQK